MMILGLVRLFATLLASSSKNTRTLVGSQFASQKLEEVIASGIYSSASGNLAAYTVDASTRTEFFYQVRCDAFSASLTDPDVSYLGGYLVTVQVWWNTDSPEKARPGVGLQTAQAQRFFYPRTQVNGS